MSATICHRPWLVTNIVTYCVGSDKKGFFVAPTVIETDDPKSITMVEEIFGPVLTVYPYNDEDFEKMIDVVDSTTEYALTGAM